MAQWLGSGKDAIAIYEYKDIAASMGGTSIEPAKSPIIVANDQCAAILSPKRIAIGLIGDNNELGTRTREHLLAELGEPGHIPMAPRDIGNDAHSGRRGTLKPNVMQEV